MATGSGNIALAFGALLAGAVVIDYGVKSIKSMNVGSSTSSNTSSGTGGSKTSGAAVSATGSTESETAFAKQFLATIGAPQNSTNIKALEDWWSQEEGSDVLVPGHGGLNNPFEVTTSGNVTVPSEGSVNSAGVKSYATTQDGVNAAVGYFETYGPGVITALQQGQSISSIEEAVRNLGANAFGSDTDSEWK